MIRRVQLAIFIEGYVNPHEGVSMKRRVQHTSKADTLKAEDIWFQWKEECNLCQAMMNLCFQVCFNEKKSATLIGVVSIVKVICSFNEKKSATFRLYLVNHSQKVSFNEKKSATW